MDDYSRIASVIRYLHHNYRQQPSLSDLAQAAGLSESHFHRLFHRWAGITPKDFVQSLTVEHAKERLRQSVSVLEAAFDSGLSGPGRLHDLMVTIEGASPGEYKSGGSGMCIEWGKAHTPFGVCTLAWNSRGICHLSFDETSENADHPNELFSDWPNAKFTRDDKRAQHMSRNVFNFEPGLRTSLNVYVRATEFQLKVWRALLRIPEGCVASYQWLAKAIGSPKASRAVGSACGCNPVGFLIPCHRVIRETGLFQGYKWGTERKKAILAWESSGRIYGVPSLQRTHEAA